MDDSPATFRQRFDGYPKGGAARPVKKRTKIILLVSAVVLAALAVLWLLLPSAADVAGLADAGEILALHASSSNEIMEQWELTEPEKIGRVLAVLQRSKVICPFPSLKTGTMIHITAEVVREDGTAEKAWIYASGLCGLTINGTHYLVVGLPGTRDAWRAMLEQR